MGIRTLNRRTAPAPANANTAGDAPTTAHPSAPPFAAGASTARIPADLTSTLRHKAATFRHRLPHHAPAWAELARSYLALARTWLPRSRPVRTVTVFIATAATLSEPQDGSAPDRPHPNPSPHPHPRHQGPGPDATP
ncbi:hypothetical protein EJ357_11710 [Streptomyces cyaneochromogenes]|uniref:Uncharacterized protein n=1 Tax=Streptomyces cyaneochromogenes TaxID=2496836 RepID=A0A3Q9EMA7_9ACTN|nr:hypothetical protein EJ357_11710 [Streptomyces cyaneochromogenes]